MEPLNEAQQECKQKGLSVGARGRLRVGREEEDEQSRSQALHVVLLSFVQPAGQRLCRLEASGA